MIEKDIDYYDGDVLLKGTLITAEEYSIENQAAIILFHAGEGKCDFILEYARKLSSHGYTTFVADMYGNAQVANTFDELLKIAVPVAQNRQLVRRRSVLAYETLIKQPGINLDEIGAIGFCLGGMCVLELARSGANLKAGVSVHGFFQKSDLETHKIKSSLLILHGYKDPQQPPEALPEFAKEMEDAGVCSWTFTFFGTAKHAFTDPNAGTMDPVREKEAGREFNPFVANRAYRYALDFFNEKLLNMG